jgi:hypothetical protein
VKINAPEMSVRRSQRGGFVYFLMAALRGFAAKNRVLPRTVIFYRFYRVIFFTASMIHCDDSTVWCRPDVHLDDGYIVRSHHYCRNSHVRDCRPRTSPLWLRSAWSRWAGGSVSDHQVDKLQTPSGHICRNILIEKESIGEHYASLRRCHIHVLYTSRCHSSLNRHRSLSTLIFFCVIFE